MPPIFNKCMVIIVAIVLWSSSIDGSVKGKFINEEIHRTKRQAIEFFEKETNFVDKNAPVSTQRSNPIIKTITYQAGAPEAPQNIRIRGNGVLNRNEGRIELFLNDSKLWASVCDDYWTMNSANAACKMIGYGKGAREANTNDRYGPSTLNKNVMVKFICFGSRNSKDGCTKSITSCNGKSAGVSCKLNEGCPYGWISYKGACFQVEQSLKTFKEANQFCSKQNSKLVYPLTTEENNFLSNVLKTEYKSINRVWTGGYYTEIKMDNGKYRKLWKFNSTIHTMDNWNLNKFWFPGFTNDPLKTKRPISNPRSRSCIAMSTLYKKPLKSELYNVDYFWWDNLSCEERLPFICQKTIRRGRTGRDCYNSNGVNYRGSVSRTNQGSVCAKWTSPEAPINPSTNNDVGLGDHNYCRNPDNDIQPWCWVNPSYGVYGYCDLMKCSELPVIQTTTAATVQIAGFGKGGCSNELYHCPSMIPYRRQCLNKIDVCNKIENCIGGEDEDLKFCEKYMCNIGEFFCKKDLFCISKNFVCDGRIHCSDKSDEKNCTFSDEKKLLLQNFDVIPQSAIESSQNINFFGLSPEGCMRECILWQVNFACKSFNFIEMKGNKPSECSLHTTTADTSLLKTIPDGNVGAHYSLKSKCTDKTKFRCNWGLCIPFSNKCNKKDDCGNNFDETNCEKNETIPFDIRLVGSDKPDEGLVNVRYNGEWGYVCDDEFDKKDADVICLMMGYEKLAEAAIKMAAYKYKSEQPTNILVSKMNCTGTEISMEMCKHAPWRQHRCSPDQLAGVICRTDRACSDMEYRCKSNGNCIPLSKVCDGTPDCTDKSDEPVGKCQLKVELVGTSKPTKGRIEISKGYTKGTICNDGFDINAAKVICRMLGYTGNVALLQKGQFPGTDKGLVAASNLHCMGSESSLDKCRGFKFAGGYQCSHDEDVGIDCAAPAMSTTTPVPTTPVPSRNTCGLRPIVQRRSRVVGGRNAIYGTLPWQVKIPYKDSYGNERHHCGGTIINDRYILTAAHCFMAQETGAMYPKYLFYVRAGEGDITKVEPSEQHFSIDELILHPDYERYTFNNDLAIIKIKPKNGQYIQFSNYVQPACLPKPDSEIDRYTKCLVSGWGATHAGSQGTDTLKYAEVPMLNRTVCNNLMQRNLITEKMQCAGYRQGGIDACQGDSGGPLVCRSKGKYTIFGVTSWGIGCGLPNSPGVYTKIKEFLPYIKQITGVNY